MSHEFAHANMAHSWLLSGTFIVKHLYSFIAPSSLLANNIASANAAASAIGPAYITPSIPIINEKIIIRGKRNSTCLVRDMTIPDSVLRTGNKGHFLFRKCSQSDGEIAGNKGKIWWQSPYMQSQNNGMQALLCRIFLLHN